MSIDPHNEHPIRILSLDGGGVRGLSSLLILRELMKRITLKRGRTHSRPILPSDYFDLIIGTGTGGISALFLGRMRMTVDEAIDQYVRVAKTGFNPSSSGNRTNFWNQKVLLDAYNVQTTIANITEQFLEDRDAVLKDSSPCHTAILATTSVNASIHGHVFQSYSNHRPASTMAIHEVACATISTTELFPPAWLGNPPIKFTHAGYMGYHNPAEFVLSETPLIWPGRPVGCLVSLGTGLVQQTIGTHEEWPEVAQTCFEITRACEEVHHTLCSSEQLRALSYFRFNAVHGPEEMGFVGVMEWSEQGSRGDMIGGTMFYLRETEVSSQLETCARVLSGEQTGLTEEEANDDTVHEPGLPGGISFLPDMLAEDSDLESDWESGPEHLNGSPPEPAVELQHLNNPARRPSIENLTFTSSQTPEPFSRQSDLCLDGKIINRSEYLVASGGNADVWMGSIGNKSVAIKIIWAFSNTGNRIHKNKLFKRLWREYLTWSTLSHPNILECLGFSYDFTPDSYDIPSLISPWMSEGTVLPYIDNHPTVDRVRILEGIAKGLSYLHDRDPAIVHGDLRAGNVLVSRAGDPCLTDFGMSRILSDIKGWTTSSEIAGSLRWMSPELFKDDIAGNKVSQSSDVWAFGMTVLEVISGERPYHEFREPAVLHQILAGRIPLQPIHGSIPSAFPDKLWAICQNCWQLQPLQRPPMREILSKLVLARV